MNYLSFFTRKSQAFALFLILFSFSAIAQDYSELIIRDPERAAGIYHYYEYSETPLTPAPKGYKPFYISHYSRHGSRYHSSSSFFKNAINGLSAAEDAGILSDEGKLLLSQIDTLYDEHQGLFGMLTKRGAEEQNGIGRRMYENYPQVFNGKDGRDKVACVSSYWPRCLVSMANCVTGIQKETEKMSFSYATGPKYLDYISMNLDTKEVSSRAREMTERIGKGLIPYDRFFAAVFTDSQEALELIKDPEAFMASVYDSGSISPNTDLKPDIFSHFTTEELIGEWILRNNSMYYRYGVSEEEGDYVSSIAKPLIQDIVSKADEAVQLKSEVSADLRFGHDVGLLPLIGTIGIQGMEKRFKSDDVQNHWLSFQMIPMASNLQMIFYRDKKNEVLVKLVYNEKETFIPALKTFRGPYYRWEDLRDYLINTEKAIPDNNLVKDSGEKERTGVTGL